MERSGQELERVAVPGPDRGEVTAVYVIDRDGRPLLRQVRVGESVGDEQVEILAGLTAGDRIAANPVQAGMASAVAAAGR